MRIGFYAGSFDPFTNAHLHVVKQSAKLFDEIIIGIDTVYIRAGELGNISSSMVMELLRNNRDVSKYLPKEVLALVKKYLFRKKQFC